MLARASNHALVLPELAKPGSKCSKSTLNQARQHTTQVTHSELSKKVYIAEMACSDGWSFSAQYAGGMVDTGEASK